MALSPNALRRGYLADAVFTELGAEILRGDHEPGAVFPAERVLSERFGVSKLLVREAVHRLAEAGLLDVRQGGATRVKDPAGAADLRVIELFYRLAPDSEAARDLTRHVLEKQYTQGLSLVALFALRAGREARDELVRIAAEDPADERALASYEERFWSAAARGGQNRILGAEVRWWYAALASRPTMPDPPPIGARMAFYRELAALLREGRDAVSFYVETLSPSIEALAKPRAAHARKRR